MNTKLIKSSFIMRTAVTLLLTVLTMTGAWAQVPITVSTEQELTDAIANDAENIRLTGDIQLSMYLDIDDDTVTIDLNGHRLYRELGKPGSDGHVIWVHNNGKLTLKSSAKDYGVVEGGKANNGGAIHIPFGNTVIAEKIIFQNNSAADHAGAIWNNGEFTATNCTFQKNTASDVGAIYNAATSNGAGMATLTNCTFTGNEGTTGAGALGNALGATVMNLDDCTITDNIASGHGGGIWNGGTLTATNSIFTNNKAYDVGAIYNAASSDGSIAGKATLNGCTFTGNVGTTGAGALANALGATVMNLDGCTITGNKAGRHGGGIWNGGTLKVVNSIFTDNTANDVGAIFNAVSSDGKIAGTATLENCTITGNKGTDGAGALANAVGNTVLTIDGCTITDNTASSNGGGIWNGGTLNMKGKVTVTGNKKVASLPGNVFLKSGKVITIVNDGLEAGSSIGIDMESKSGTFTSGYNDFHHEVDPISFFTADQSVVMNLGLDSKGEACLTSNTAISLYCIEKSWDDTNKQVVNTLKTITGDKIGYDATPVEGQYKEVTNAPGSSSFEWFGMGGYSNSVAEYYVVRGNVERRTIVVQGKDVHLILCDGATLTLTGGLKLEDDNKLHIHSQSYGSEMGKLMVINAYENAAGIGSAQHEGKEKTVGELVIHGGHIEATGGKKGAGIGSCARVSQGEKQLCNSVTVYGGYVNATGGVFAAGIGGGAGFEDSGIDGGRFVLYDGTVIARGGTQAAGLGGGGAYSKDKGNCGNGGEVIVYGGTLTAIGGDDSAGIGSGSHNNNQYVDKLCGGTFTIHGGKVTANGKALGAGIGGGYKSGGAKVEIFGGTVTANGGFRAAGIGGGDKAKGGTMTVTGGTVTAIGGSYAAGIGGGDYGNPGTLTVSGGMVTAKGGQWGPGIGGGRDGKSGKVTISGGKVTAEGGQGGAGIGGGYHGWAADVTITGGFVIAKAGIQEGYGHRAIGPGQESGFFASTVIGDTMMVAGGSKGRVDRIYGFPDHLYGYTKPYAEISPCTHNEAFYTIGGTDSKGTHTKNCRYCTKKFPDEKHTMEYGKCTVCGMEAEAYTVTIYVPDLQAGSGYATINYQMVPGTKFYLPGCNVIPDGLEFAGWLENAPEAPSDYLTTEGETLLEEQSEYNITGNISLTARYIELNISLADDSNNEETILNYDGRKAASVTLTGRTLYKDGIWNTLCLPFAVTDGDANDGVTFSGTPLEDATVLTLADATMAINTLTFNFEETTVIEPGKPYLVKWASDTEHPTIVNPVFNGVTISYSTPDENGIDAGIVSFKGHYAPMKISEEGNITVFYLGDDNKFRYPNGAMDINAFRAYFQANTSLGDVNGDGFVNVTDVTLLVNYILGQEVDESFIFENADITRDGIISVSDVTGLTDIILGGNSILKVVFNGVDGISFSRGGYGPARTRKN